MMRNKFSLLFIIAIIAIITNCKNPTDGISVTLNTDVSKSNISLHFLDASQMDQINLDQIQISIVGKDANKIYNADGTTDFTTANGFISLILQPGISPTKSNPIKFTVIAKLNGYLNAVYPIVLEQEEDFTAEILMVNLGDLPTGVSMVKSSFSTDVNGALESDYFTEITPKNGKYESANLKIKKGTIIKDDKGNVLTGQVNVQMLHFDSRDSQSLRAFPGGFMTANLLNNQGQEMEGGIFQTAGFISLDMECNGVEVKNFSQPIEVNVEVAEDIVNPETNQVLKAGDSIPVWSLNPKDGTWREEGSSVVVFDATKQKLVNSLKMNHLSYWNLDFYFRRCSVGAIVTFDYTGPSLYHDIQLQYKSPRLQYLNWYNRRQFPIYRGANLLLYNGTSTEQARIVVYSNETRQIVGQTNYFTLCNGQISCKVNYVPHKIVKVNVWGRCVNTNRIYKPTAWLYYINDLGRWECLGLMNNGKFETNKLKIGRTYVIGTAYGSKWYQNPITIFTDNFESINWELPKSFPGCR